MLEASPQCPQYPHVLTAFQLANHSQNLEPGRQHYPPKEAILHALLACQAQNRTTIPRKSRDDSHILRLTGTATAMQSVKMILRLERKGLTK